MNKQLAVAGLLALLMGVSSCRNDRAICDDTVTCESLIRDLATERVVARQRITQARSNLIRTLDAPWSFVSALALDQDLATARIAGRLMADWEPLSDEAIVDVLRAIERDPKGAAVRALGTIGTRAAALAMLDLMEKGHSGSQACADLFLLALPEFVLRGADYTQYDDPCSVRTILANLRPFQSNGTDHRLRSALNALMAISVDTENDERLRHAALQQVAYFIPTSEFDVTALRQNLQDKIDPLYAATVRQLIIQGDPSVLAETWARCEAVQASQMCVIPNGPDFGLLNECLDPLARTKHAAAVHAPKLIVWLDLVNSESRNLVLATLGHLGNKEVIPTLIDSLNSDDERDVSASLESLWRLRATRALPMIDNVHNGHWLPTVREFARLVAGAIRDPQRDSGVSSALLYGWDPDSAAGQHVHGPALSHVDTPHSCERWEADGKPLAFENLKISDQGPPATTGFENLAGFGRPTFNITDVTLHRTLAGGTLFGVNRGKGSGLHYHDPILGLIELDRRHVTALVRHRPGEVLAIVQADHGGAVMRISGTDGNLTVVAQRRLPSAPGSAAHPTMHVGKRIFVPMIQGGAVLVDPDLGFASAQCVPSEGIQVDPGIVRIRG